jgi:hypothetical protein
MKNRLLLRSFILSMALCTGAYAESQVRGDYLGMSFTNSTGGCCWSEEAHAGLDTVYVWVGSTRSVKTLEFMFTGTFSLIDFIPFHGVANLGSTQEPYLVVSGPPYIELPQLLGALVLEDVSGVGAELCLGESSNGRLCGQITDRDTWYRLDSWTGFTTIGKFPCQGQSFSKSCTNIAVDPESWGEVKARYR